MNKDILKLEKELFALIKLYGDDVVFKAFQNQGEKYRNQIIAEDLSVAVWSFDVFEMKNGFGVRLVHSIDKPDIRFQPLLCDYVNGRVQFYGLNEHQLNVLPENKKSLFTTIIYDYDKIKYRVSMSLFMELVKKDGRFSL